MEKKEIEKMEVVLFGKKYEVTQKELAILYKGVGIRKPGEEAKFKFDELRAEKRMEELKKDPERLLQYIMNEMKAAIDIDYLLTGGYSKAADDLIKFLPEEQLKVLEKYVNGEYKETIDNVRKERAEKESKKESKEIEENKERKAEEDIEDEFDDDKIDEKIEVTLFEKKYQVTEKQLTKLYQGLGIRDADFEAEMLFDDIRNKNMIKELKKDPERLLEYIINQMKDAINDFLTGGYSKEADDLIKFLPEKQLKELEKKVNAGYKETIDNVRKKRAEKESKKAKSIKPDNKKKKSETNDSGDEVEF